MPRKPSQDRNQPCSLRPTAWSVDHWRSPARRTSMTPGASRKTFNSSASIPASPCSTTSRLPRAVSPSKILIERAPRTRGSSVRLSVAARQRRQARPDPAAARAPDLRDCARSTTPLRAVPSGSKAHPAGVRRTVLALSCDNLRQLKGVVGRRAGSPWVLCTRVLYVVASRPSWRSRGEESREWR
jgi:hypothetical protein